MLRFAPTASPHVTIMTPVGIPSLREINGNNNTKKSHQWNQTPKNYPQ
jgi:hypothetical protein